MKKVRNSQTSFPVNIVKQISETFVRKYFMKKVFLKMLQNSQKTLMLESHFNKVVGLYICNFIKKETPAQVFPMNLAKFLRTLVLKNICECLLLRFQYRSSRSQVLFKIAVLKKLRNIHRKTSVLEPWRPVTLFKRDFNTVVFL